MYKRDEIGFLIANFSCMLQPLLGPLFYDLLDVGSLCRTTQEGSHPLFAITHFNSLKVVQIPKLNIIDVFFPYDKQVYFSMTCPNSHSSTHVETMGRFK